MSRCIAPGCSPHWGQRSVWARAHCHPSPCSRRRSSSVLRPFHWSEGVSRGAAHRPTLPSVDHRGSHDATKANFGQDSFPSEVGQARIGPGSERDLTSSARRVEAELHRCPDRTPSLTEHAEPPSCVSADGAMTLGQRRAFIDLNLNGSKRLIPATCGHPGFAHVHTDISIAT